MESREDRRKKKERDVLDLGISPDFSSSFARMAKIS
jgi:hypothetical protein